MTKVGWRDFIVWQCSIRQRNFRMFQGKPSEGIVCKIYDKKNNQEIKNFVSVFLEKKVKEASKMFEYMNRRTHDPEERYSKAVKLFSSEYFNTPENFDGRFTATFMKNDNFINDLKSSKKYNVQFFERDTGFDFPVKIKKLKKGDSEWQCTFWHNLMFNPSLNDNIEVLLFTPVKTELKSKS
tara:strand:- start:82 stop:627 length:546 start_codon:yes stop_codon:yes gene_type:complete